MSGYTIVPGIIMGGIVQRSAIHYAGKGSSNYGSWGILDWVSGTSKGRDVFADVKKEADKHHVKERSSKKIDQGVNAVREGVKTRRSSRKKTSQ